MIQNLLELTEHQNLFRHKYDVDDVIRALCGDDHSGRWLLNTDDGQFIAEEPQNPINTNQGNWYKITPLPLSIKEEMCAAWKFTRLSEEEQADVKTLLAKASATHHFLSLFEQGIAGGWLRERMKEYAVEWLNERDMIPPSMRHVQNISSKPPVADNTGIEKTKRVKVRFETT